VTKLVVSPTAIKENLINALGAINKMPLTLLGASASDVDLMINKIVMDATKNNGINMPKSA
jgi:hypothetical protein